MQDFYYNIDIKKKIILRTNGDHHIDPR
jgi:hypothetical protein